MADFYFASDGNQQGPYPVEHLLSHGLRRDSLVWREGMGEWQRADTVSELAGLFRAAPPVGPVGVFQAPGAGQRYVPPAPVQPVGYSQPYGVPPTSGMAVTSMIMGILALVPCFSWLCLVFAILAIAFGVSARAAINRGQAAGGGMATAGIVCGIISLAIVLVFIFLILGIGLHAGRGFWRF